MNTKSSLMKEDFQQWKPSPGGKKVRSKSKSTSFAPNKGAFEAKSTAKSDYTSVSIQNSNQGRAKPKYNLKV